MKKSISSSYIILVLCYCIVAAFLSTAHDKNLWMKAQRPVIHNEPSSKGAVNYYYYLVTRQNWDIYDYYIYIGMYCYILGVGVLLLILYFFGYMFIYNESSYCDKSKLLLILVFCVSMFLINYPYYVDFIFSPSTPLNVCDRYKYFTRDEFNYLEKTYPKTFKDPYCAKEIKKIKNTNEFLWVPPY